MHSSSSGSTLEGYLRIFFAVVRRARRNAKPPDPKAEG